MGRRRTLPGGRAAVYLGGTVGLVRAAEEALAESAAPKEEIDPSTNSEPDDVTPKWVWVVGVGVLIVLWAVVLLIYPLFRYFSYSRTGGVAPSRVLEYIPPQPPPPRNESDAAAQLAAFRARETYMLTHYLWVDRGKGSVIIPIQRAIDLLAQRGVPPSETRGTEYYPPHAGTMRTGSLEKVEQESQ